MQIRLVDFGTSVTAEKVKSVNKAFSTPHVLNGGLFTVGGTNLLAIAPHTVVLPSGVVMEETETQTLTVPSTANTSYTVRYQHMDSNAVGGSSATLEIVPGLFTEADNSITTVLGWIRYTSGALAAEMLYPAPQRQLNAAVTAGDGETFYATEAMEGAITSTLAISRVFDTSLGWRIDTTNGTPGSLGLTLVQFFTAGREAPKSVRMSAIKASLTTFAFAIEGTDGIVGVMSTPIIGAADSNGISDATSRILTGNLEAGRRFKVTLTATLTPGDALSLFSITASPFDRPF